MNETTEPVVSSAPLPGADLIRLLMQTGFSPEAYRDHYPDLRAKNWGPSEALKHFLVHGIAERRIPPMTLNRQALLSLAQAPMSDAHFKATLLTTLAAKLFDGNACGHAIEERWPALRALMNDDARPYFVAGDSHSNQYRLTSARHNEWLLPIHMLLTGASARGLGNPNSRSGYGALLRQAVQAIETLPGIKKVPFLLQFGQVDLEFVHHFQRVRDGRLALDLADYREFCDRTADQYVRFLAGLFQSVRPPIFLVSVFPPALSDAAWHQGYVNADIVSRETDRPVAEMSASIRNLEVASLRQRTEIHRRYNARLRAACDRLGFGFVDSFTPFLGHDGLVDPRYVDSSSSGAGHHLDERATAEAVRDLIWPCIDKAMGNAP